jgi:hypothetical protein
MDSAVDFLAKALREEGLVAEVSEVSSDVEHCDKFIVTKDIGGEPYRVAFSVTERERAAYGTTEKLLATRAREVYQKFEDEMTETISWDENRVRLSAYDEPSAECFNCKADVSFSPQSSVPSFRKEAEISTPRPIPRATEDIVKDVDDHAHVLIKLYLLGKLRRECDPQCPNSIHSDGSSTLLR